MISMLGKPEFKQCGICNEKLPINHAGHKDCSEFMLLSKQLAPYARTVRYNSTEPKKFTLIPKCVSATNKKIRSAIGICSGK